MFLTNKSNSRLLKISTGHQSDIKVFCTPDIMSWHPFGSLHSTLPNLQSRAYYDESVQFTFFRPWAAFENTLEGYSVFLSYESSMCKRDKTSCGAVSERVPVDLTSETEITQSELSRTGLKGTGVRELILKDFSNVRDGSPLKNVAIGIKEKNLCSERKKSEEKYLQFL